MAVVPSGILTTGIERASSDSLRLLREQFPQHLDLPLEYRRVEAAAHLLHQFLAVPDLLPNPIRGLPRGHEVDGRPELFRNHRTGGSLYPGTRLGKNRSPV